jgi:GT2 family glycosyltransferase
MKDGTTTVDDAIWVVVLSYNGLDDTRKCLASLEPALRPGTTALLVDNGSTDGTADVVRTEFSWARVLRVEPNRGPAAGNNAGIRAALEGDCRWILLLNNDPVVSANLLDRLREAVGADPSYGIIGPVIKFMGDPELVMTDGCIFNAPGYVGFFQRKPVPLIESAPPRITEVDVVNSCCIFVSSDVFRRIGLFDEGMFIYHDETDLCLRARAAGFRAGVIDHALVWHKGSATTKATGRQSTRYYDARNLLYVLRKHRGARGHGRSRLRSAAMYVRYMYYWYCAELEAGSPRAAEAVIDGMCDGLSGRQGRYEDRPRALRAPIRGIFALLRRRPGRASTASEAAR